MTSKSLHNLSIGAMTAGFAEGGFSPVDVTRAQGIFSPRTVNVHFGLDYIAENLDTPAVVLQYPSKLLLAGFPITHVSSAHV